MILNKTQTKWKGKFFISVLFVLQTTRSYQRNYLNGNYLGQIDINQRIPFDLVFVNRHFDIVAKQKARGNKVTPLYKLA